MRVPLVVMLRCFTFFLALAFSSGAMAQSVDPDRLNELSQQAETEKAREAELGKSRDAVVAEIQSLRQTLIRIAAEAESYERSGRQIEAKLADLTTQQAALKTRIYADRKTLMKLLGALQRVEVNPPPALAVSPQDAADAVRAAKLMSSMTEDLKSRADTLTVELEGLAKLKTNIETEKEKLKQNEVLLGTKRERISGLVAQKARLEKSISTDQANARKRVAALAAEASSLRDLISRFERSSRGVVPRLKPDVSNPTRPGGVSPRVKPNEARPPEPLVLPPDTRRFADARGSVRAPVRGRVTKTYTKARKGITVSTRPKAQVVAPYAGRVEFAGPFKNYDNVVILNMGEGYFMLLTGLGEIYAKTNAIVSSGEPLGLMPFNTQEAEELYIEIRKNGAAVNPNPWLGTAFAGNG